MAQGQGETSKQSDVVMFSEDTTVVSDGESRVEFATERVEVPLGELKTGAETQQSKNVDDQVKNSNLSKQSEHKQVTAMGIALDPLAGGGPVTVTTTAGKSTLGTPKVLPKEGSVSAMCQGGVGPGCRLSDATTDPETAMTADEVDALVEARERIKQLQAKRRRLWWWLVGVIVLGAVGIVCWQWIAPILLPVVTSDSQADSQDVQKRRVSLAEIFDVDDYTMMYSLQGSPFLENVKVVKQGDDYSVQAPYLGYELVKHEGQVYRISHGAKTVVATDEAELAKFIPLTKERIGEKLEDGEGTINGGLYRSEKYDGLTAFFEVDNLRFVRIGNNLLYEIWSFEPRASGGKVGAWPDNYRFLSEDEGRKQSVDLPRTILDISDLAPGEFRVVDGDED